MSVPTVYDLENYTQNKLWTKKTTFSIRMRVTHQHIGAGHRFEILAIFRLSRVELGTDQLGPRPWFPGQKFYCGAYPLKLLEIRSAVVHVDKSMFLNDLYGNVDNETYIYASVRAA